MNVGLENIGWYLVNVGTSSLEVHCEFVIKFNFINIHSILVDDLHTMPATVTWTWIQVTRVMVSCYWAEELSFIVSRCLWYSFRDSNLFKSQELTGTGAVGLAKLILHCDGSSFCVVLMLLVMCWTIAWKEVNDSGSHCTSTKRARASAELVTIPLNTHATEVVLTVRAFLRLLTC